MCVCVFVLVYVCKSSSVFKCVCKCEHACTGVCVHFCMLTNEHYIHENMIVCECVCVCVCVYVIHEHVDGMLCNQPKNKHYPCSSDFEQYLYCFSEVIKNKVYTLESRSAPRKTCRYLPIRPVPLLDERTRFYARFWSIWREYSNKTFLNYYGTLPVSFVYSLLSAPRGT